MADYFPVPYSPGRYNPIVGVPIQGDPSPWISTDYPPVPVAPRVRIVPHYPTPGGAMPGGYYGVKPLPAPVYPPGGVTPNPAMPGGFAPTAPVIPETVAPASPPANTPDGSPDWYDRWDKWYKDNPPVDPENIGPGIPVKPEDLHPGDFVHSMDVADTSGISAALGALSKLAGGGRRGGGAVAFQMQPARYLPASKPEFIYTNPAAAQQASTNYRTKLAYEGTQDQGYRDYLARLNESEQATQRAAIQGDNYGQQMAAQAREGALNRASAERITGMQEEVRQRNVRRQAFQEAKLRGQQAQIETDRANTIPGYKPPLSLTYKGQDGKWHPKFEMPPESDNPDAVPAPGAPAVPVPPGAVPVPGGVGLGGSDSVVAPIPVPPLTAPASPYPPGGITPNPAMPGGYYQ